MLIFPAPAKINLYLHVTGQRDDGYHLLDSLMAFSGLGDVIEVTEANHLTLSMAGPFGAGLPTGPDNLVILAARGLQNLCSVDFGARIRLIKNLPVASGIGGGSADAATTLRALSALWHVSPDEDALMELALSLGADVPICLSGKAAFVSGIGETISPVSPLPEIPMVLINPGVAVSTPEIFKARTESFSKANPFAANKMSTLGLISALKQRTNDLSEPAIRLQPVIGDVLEQLQQSEGVLLHRMSGSGATCFGLFETSQQVQMAANTIKRSHPDWWVEETVLKSG